MLPLMIIVTALGVWFIVSALLNWEWFYGIMEFAIIEGLFGEGISRIVCGIAGVALTIGGIIGVVNVWTSRH
ncbi:MAG TPA: hypothetical protein VKS79_25385 [Gemmataceae bacterium]|nr:hypothetical protein [Gemmataceae bacterium]